MWMESGRDMAQIYRTSSQLELEAAQYFKLDLSQLNLNQNQSERSAASPLGASKAWIESDCRHHTKSNRGHRHPHHNRHRHDMMSCKHDASELATPAVSRSRMPVNRKAEPSIRPTDEFAPYRPPVARKRQHIGPHKPTDNSNQPSRRLHNSKGSGSFKLVPRLEGKSIKVASRETSESRLNVASTTQNGSSTTSTNSLPSISSSPSISPSIICPHLSLDDLLEFRLASRNVSPHTIGLCPRCRLDPPPNVHSPLSPLLKPFACKQGTLEGKMNKSSGDLRPSVKLENDSLAASKRIDSDHQASRYTKSRSLSNVSRENSVRRQINMRDDSLDFALEPSELRRLQMSPTVRNSVEFIRKNSIESGRVLRIYKNGEPFEKPLRVCIMRGEFANIDHLLDHINTRLLVSLGVRYLFHLDGQLVYSVEELKHCSIYIVSGTRFLDNRTCKLLKEHQDKERLQHKSMNRNEQDSVSSVRSTVSVFKTNPKQHPPASIDKSRNQPAKGFDPSKQNRGRENLGRASSNKSTTKPNTLHDRNRVDGAAPRSCDSLTEPIEKQEQPTRLLRAKSELSALPKKRKKNVTFMDTGRGSSPAMSDSTSTAKEAGEVTLSGIGSERATDLPVKKSGSPEGEQSVSRAVPISNGTSRIDEEGTTQMVSGLDAKKESTSSIGIQVSDSIDGFLIDLPVALPARRDDSNLRRNDNPRRTNVSRANMTGKAGRTEPKKRQFVTITERQLSLDEMNELKDLTQGDHHHESNVEQDREDAQTSGTQETESDSKEPEVIPDRTQTISIGCDPQVDESIQTTPVEGEIAVPRTSTSRLVTSSQAQSSRKEGQSTEAVEHWQYLGGDASSTTPTERPVSQSGPNEAVRARVTTPTPSISTTGGPGDEISLAMSYETNSLDSHPTSSKPPQRIPLKLPPKRRVEVVGKLFSGLHPPEHNFRLLWVNGFSINDLYPENSVNEQQLVELEGKEERASSNTSNGGVTHLKPDHSRRQVGHLGDKTKTFKPSSRYHNWICHSRHHNELIYPAGSLIVLWCQWTNEQRFYASHTSNVSAVALATLDSDLAASAQVCELYQRPFISANIHLWSISELNTLMVIEDEQMRTKVIFSIRLKNSKSHGCELSVAAQDNKQMLLFTFRRKLGQQSPSIDEERKSEVSSTSPKRGNRNQLGTNSNLRANRATHSNQVVLFIMRVPAMSFRVDAIGKQQQVSSDCDPVICFGRRCFQIWYPDVRQQKLRLMQPDGKSSELSSLLIKSNCLCRLSPSELLAGDADGNIALVATNLHANYSPGETAKRVPTKSMPSHDARDLKYSIKITALLGPLASKSESMKTSATKSWPGITSLARVTGSLFMSADTTCAIRFWKIHWGVDKKLSLDESLIPTVKLSSDISSEVSGQIHCEQLASIALPKDLGFVCTILLSNYNRTDSVVEFYIVSTSNTILFGSVKLQQVRTGERASAQQELLANSSLSVVYEGHETSVSSLVADMQLPTRAQKTPNTFPTENFYFTCSLDSRICKWNGKDLVWKSLLPSPCVSLAVHPNGFVLAVGSIDGTVYILDKVTGLLISYFPLTPVRINCLAYSSDGSLLAAGCSNGSIFILPVYERGLKYKKVSIFQSPNAVVSLQFSYDNRYILTSVTHGSFQQLILWDLPNFRYMRENVKLVADRIRWFDSICSGSEDVRAIWENANLTATKGQEEGWIQRSSQKRPSAVAGSATSGSKRLDLRREIFVTNLSCHRLVKTELPLGEVEPKKDNHVIASDTQGFLRLFRYPSYDIQQGFYAVRISSSAVNCCRFLNALSNERGSEYFVSSSLDGSICLWLLD